MATSKKPEPQTQALHLRLPRDLYLRLLARLAQMRKDKPLATLSDAARAVIEAGLKR